MSLISDLAEAYWKALLAANPTEGHLLGLTEYAGAFEDASREAEDARLGELRDVEAKAAALTGLDADDELTRQVLLAEARSGIDRIEARLPELEADPIFGLQASAGVLLPLLGVPDATVAAAMPGTLAGMGRYFDALSVRLGEGLAHGRVPARFAVEDTVAQIEAYLATPLAEDALVAAVELPEGSDRQPLADAVAQQLRPAMQRYVDVLRGDVLAHARDDAHAGLVALPDGAETYARMLRVCTSTSLTAEQIHQIGLDQVAELAEEYRSLGGEVLGTSDLEEIFERMRTDPALHFQTGDQLVEASRRALAASWEALGDWFETLPEAPCGVEGVESGAKAYYFPPAADGSRGGTFFVNIEGPSDWGTFELESMAFHEGIPGHHLQLSIAGELPDTIPDFRRYGGNNAYVEGWGLYAERLADEMGLYSSGVDRLGMLSADSLRACRLVVDTGIHALGWSRQQAVDYMVANSPMTAGIVRPEIDRYVVSPGQACGYMIGRLEIMRLRREARARQGDAFDIKAFHTAVLGAGPLPLAVLDAHVAMLLP